VEAAWAGRCNQNWLWHWHRLWLWHLRLHTLRSLAPLVYAIREQDRSLADQLKRAAQSVVLNIAEARGNDAGNARARFSTACGSAKEVRAALNVASDWGYIESHTATHLDGKLDEVCAITWCLGRKL